MPDGVTEPTVDPMSITTMAGGLTVTLEDILITPELPRRRSRAPDYVAENRALVALAREMATNPKNLPQKLVDLALELCRAGTAGISLLKSDSEGEYFSWVALAGMYAPRVGGRTPRNFSPCGTTLDRGAPQLFSVPARYFTYFEGEDNPIAEGLVIPFALNGHALGTIWVVTHDKSRRFDAEDVRIMTALAEFTAAALQTLSSRDAATQAQDDLRRINKALRESEALFRELLFALPAAVYTTDREGRITLFNDQAAQLWGRRPEIGKDLWCGSWRIFRPDGTPLPHEQCPMAVALHQGRSVRGQEIVVERPDGTRLCVLPHPEPLRDAAGEVVGAVNMLVDITHRKCAEEELRGAHDELGMRVEERTAELAKVNETLKAEIEKHKQTEVARMEFMQQLINAKEAERHRIARELHDQMGQHLTALILGLKLLKDGTPESSPARERLQQLQELADLIGKEVHHVALELRPTALDDFGLHTTLVNYVEEWSERSGVGVDFHSTGLDGKRLPSPIETALYRMVQEGLTNVLKHAQARRVSLIIQCSPDQVLAILEDDGRGFDTATVTNSWGPRGRLGLLGMRERVALVGGNLTIESTPERGTTIFARIPLPADREEYSNG
ncbi:MAG TPA: histidine kinase [Gemmataceae bacterium]|nr:histidine kinase [Gemmataceae bacterium]